MVLPLCQLFTKMTVNECLPIFLCIFIVNICSIPSTIIIELTNPLFSPNKSWTELIILSALNSSHACFVFQERSYKLTSAVDQMAVHFVLEGSLLHQDSDEARRLRAKDSLPEGSYWYIKNKNIHIIVLFIICQYQLIFLFHNNCTECSTVCFLHVAFYFFFGVVHTWCHKVSLSTCATKFSKCWHLHNKIMIWYSWYVQRLQQLTVE